MRVDFKIKGKLSTDGVTYIGQETKRRRVSQSAQFVRTAEWRALRKEALRLYGAVCAKCGSTDSIQVDHIKPKSRQLPITY